MAKLQELNEKFDWQYMGTNSSEDYDKTAC
jgi:hypothetical protein